MRDLALQPAYTEVGGRRLFQLDVLPSTPPLAWVFHVPPLGEEAVRSRRWLSAVARRLAEVGLAVRTVDLHGTGDSDGATHVADLATWVSDTETLVARLGAEQHLPVALWGTRAGALIAGSSSSNHPLLLLAPVTDGARYARQLSRRPIARDNPSGAAEAAGTVAPGCKRDPIPALSTSVLADLANVRSPIEPAETRRSVFLLDRPSAAPSSAPAGVWYRRIDPPRFWAVEETPLDPGVLAAVEDAGHALLATLADVAHAP